MSQQYYQNTHDSIELVDSIVLSTRNYVDITDTIEFVDEIQSNGVRFPQKFEYELFETIKIADSADSSFKFTFDTIKISDQAGVRIGVKYFESINLFAIAGCSATVPAAQGQPNPIYKKLSGILINQNQFASDKSLSNLSKAVITQQFELPEDYIRSGKISPDITGFQIYLKGLINNEDNVNQAELEFSIDRRPNGSTGWISLAHGVQKLSIPKEFNLSDSETPEDFWFTVDQLSPIKIESDWIDSTFRIQISELSNNLQKIYYQERLNWNNATSYVAGDVVVIEKLVNQIKKYYGYLCLKTNINKNPESDDGTNWKRDPFVDYAVEISGDGVVGKPTNEAGAVIPFRIFAAIADEGTDFLNNKYRSSVFITNTENVLLSNTNSTWLSKPNPSKFGIENLYFDIRNNNRETNVDSVLVDPITPGLLFNVYYSNDSTTELNSPDDWDSLLWTRVPRTFRATKRQNYVFPEPVSAKYIKIEFTNLQAKYYAPGDFQKPVLYKKYPQWVFDYFIADYMFKRNKTYDPFIQGEVSIVSDVYELAFNYYKGDIIQSPAGAIEIKDLQSNKTELIGIISDTAKLQSVDSNTASRIQAVFDKFSSHPSASAEVDSTIGQAATSAATNTYGMNVLGYKTMTGQNYPRELISTVIADTALVSTTDREPLLLEKKLSPMFFYIKCRHQYKEALATFEDNRAYFAGIKEVAFQRVNHVSEYDSLIYNYGVNENSLNVEYNDFILSEGYWSAE